MSRESTPTEAAISVYIENVLGRKLVEEQNIPVLRMRMKNKFLAICLLSFSTALNQTLEYLLGRYTLLASIQEAS